MWHHLKYIFAFALPIGILLSFQHGGWWYYHPVLFSFGIVPIIDAVLPRDESNLSEKAEKNFKNAYDLSKQHLRSGKVYEHLLKIQAI